MRLGGNAAALVAIVVGIVWILQGANILGGSFMSGASEWLYIGIALVVAGVIGFWWVNFRRAGKSAGM